MFYEKGQADGARKHLQWVIDRQQDDAFAALARLRLERPELPLPAMATGRKMVWPAILA